jgi:hypothetical protein
MLIVWGLGVRGSTCGGCMHKHLRGIGELGVADRAVVTQCRIPVIDYAMLNMIMILRQ